jgi:hypothetical protein
LDKRRGGMRALGAALAPITAPILGKEGGATAQLMAEWRAIVGDALAEACWPVKLSFPRGARRDGTLRLRALPAMALEIQHREPILLERINGYFGYRAVARLAMIQGPLPLEERMAPPELRCLAAEEQRALDERVSPVTDPELRAALARLGSAMIGRR